ncbi:MAG TPA: RagB/SusD family nutrient uptake outer membrane protein [Gemmatimonadaceae bacterium]|nr:RagB/SusD family nutrient uptake outer membrane protein [Gemmatimonadaceae bacterium]
MRTQSPTGELITMPDRTIRRAMRVAAAAVTLMTIAACESPLDVESTSRIPAEDVEIPSNAQMLVDGAVADFECAFAAYVVQSATVGEEFIYAQQTADRTPADRRAVVPTDQRYSSFACTAFGIYVPLQTSRNSAETALGYLAGWTDAQVSGRTRLISIAAAYAGYSYLLLGEGFCTMAISKINLDRTVEYGGEIQRDSVFRIAITRFTEAITAATAVGNTDIIRMSYVGRARAKLNLGDYAGAKADAQQVPAGYVKNATYSATVARRENLVFNDNSISGNQSSLGEAYRAIVDLRIPFVTGTGVSAPGIRHVYQTKYIANNSPIPIATYEEAQLIIAEADIRAGSLATALPILAASRARGGQSAFTGTTQAQYLTELIDQRRRELFLESQHLYDMIRFALTPTPAGGVAYHFGGGLYGKQLCFPLPQSERLNNPRIGI